MEHEESSENRVSGGVRNNLSSGAKKEPSVIICHTEKKSRQSSQTVAVYFRISSSGSFGVK